MRDRYGIRQGWIQTSACLYPASPCSSEGQTTGHTLARNAREGGHTSVLAPAHPSKDARLSRASVNQRAQVLRNQLLVSQDDMTAVVPVIRLARALLL